MLFKRKTGRLRFSQRGIDVLIVEAKFKGYDS